MDNKKILFLTPGCFDKGGISRYSRYQIEALREVFGRDNVRVLSLLGPAPDGFEMPFDVTWHGGISQVSVGARLTFAIQAFRHSVCWRPDVIHSAHVNFAPLVTKLALICDAMTVLNVYGLELWSGLSSSRAKHMAQIDHLIADCHATAAHVAAEKMHPAAPVVIWDCVDLARFSPNFQSDCKLDYGLPDCNTYRMVLTLGRLSISARHKGYDRLIEIWNDVLEYVPRARLVIAGKGDDMRRLQLKAVELGHTESVIFTGPIDESDLSALYRAAYVFALVSDKGRARGEGIPLTPLEAMASGVPILVGDEDGSCEAVDDGRNGIIVSPRELDKMTEALIDLLTEDANAHAQRVKAARQVAEERFGYERFVDKHRSFYKQKMQK